ncbi:methionine import ATP-binding protein MetN 1 [Kaistia sp. 32K]|uniref:methionine ABC transporter ATP-binding protein n=1 Tax=Kaistia sp. 32K TaxID=2795690 RepID=UPI001914DD76|nr:ATP-binding cassette domain-containing protein [Kaistia sp. 32K]BCP55498.1 methionine import ATP-binding protein MetN 1 [Kaistia sp. 32K]
MTHPAGTDALAAWAGPALRTAELAGAPHPGSIVSRGETRSVPASENPRSAASVVFEGIEKIYATPSGSVQALKDISIEIRQGEIFGFIGRSGAGKSTLIRLINRLERPTSGTVVVNGVTASGLVGEGLVQLRRRIGMIFQHFNLMSAKTVAQNVALPLVMAGAPRRQIDRKVEELLSLVGLSDKRDAYPAQLSGGQKQRVGIARALVHDPDILLCDEATSALDPETTQSILGLLREINRSNGITVVLITHEMAVIREICDRVAVLDHGRIVELGDVWKVFGNPEHEVTKSLLGQIEHGIPDDLTDRLQPGFPAGAGTLLVRATFLPESGGAPDLQAVLKVVHGPVQLLDSAVDRIRGHTVGRLLVAVPSEGNRPEEIETRLGSLPPNVQVEVLGHVSAPV